ncbi:Acyl-CoA N-acyltransferase [Penicillium argentinense]|uniref:Glucosamine 6-phosphate N-acetyltransferase n=1 Tax=Penicillium argentinense TaxID=1131581 RepID=A0A9W9FH53_9EURO|nr:Acyl-CoA N-acyltransferase [Penicillium argentinense]KAJ5100091.1 Acyl-CoA N-acyltransferase [Penicillium argentinense]
MAQPTLVTTMQPPPGPHAQLVLPESTPNTNPPVFHGAMQVRMRVFVDEQKCSADAEIDADDYRSWHWVLTDSATHHPIAVIRLVPPPQPPHELLTHPEASQQNLPDYDWAHEPCIKLTRVAVVPEYRGLGLGRQLVETALAWAGAHAGEIDAAAQEMTVRTGWDRPVAAWRGLVLVHAQVDVEQMYRRLGFATDLSLGRWDEEGIEHVGMFKRIPLTSEADHDHR